MIYTIGHTESYEKYLNEQGEDCKKSGPTPGYRGGSVWKTREDAQEYLDEYGMEDYSVYGVLADWDTETRYDDSGESWNDLLVDARIVRI